MQFELTKEFIDDLRSFITNDQETEAFKLIKDLHSADIAEIYNEIDIEEARFLHVMLDGEKAADVLVELEEDDRERFLKVLPSKTIAEFSEEKQEEVLSFIDNLEQAGDIVDLLNYDENSAGGIMAKELITVNENWSITTCLKEMRKQAEDVDEVYYVYVIDDNKVLKGTLSLKKLLLTPSNTKIKNIINEDVTAVKADTPSEEVAHIMDKYDLVALPVVDALNRLIGRITIDDVVDVIREEAERDYQLVSGITQDVESTDSAWILTRARIPWLFIGLFGGILAALIMGNYEVELGLFPQMA